MFRVLNLVSVLALLVSAGLVYHVKYSSTFEAQRIATLRSDIRKERETIAMLNAEWARRTTPDRIQSLAENHLDMQSLDVDRLDTLASLPEKPGETGDGIGGLLDALVDGPAVTGSVPKTPREVLPEALAIPRGAPKPQGAAKPPAMINPYAPQARAPQVTTPRAPLPLSAMPAAGVMGQGAMGAHGGVAAPGGPLMSSPVTSSAPLLPPGSVGQ